MDHPKKGLLYPIIQGMVGWGSGLNFLVLHQPAEKRSKMLFNSFEFLLFFPAVFMLYWFVFNKKLIWQNGLLLVSSYFFYGWWSWKFMILLMASTLLDYLYGFWVASPNRRKAKLFLWLSIINNLGILAVFKYYNFFVTQFKDGLELLGLQVNPVLIQVALPVGISFYTFHGMSYVFDIYRGLQKPVRNFLEYGVFVSFFPLLVAGPIERANHLLPQVQRTRTFSLEQATAGCRLILWGMFKKVVVADSLAILVDSTFANYQSIRAYELIIGAVAFSIQIYGDFSGYSDMALGTAKLMGFELLSNFKFPYFSRDIAEFWRRWHVSLSSWFRDYLYIPLGGSKQGKFKAVRNTFIIFLVSGFWHGANWTFITWGLIHACGFLPLLLLNKNRKYVTEVVAADRWFPTLREIIQMLITFAFVTFAWIFFRAETMGDGVAYIWRICVSAAERPVQFLHPYFLLKNPVLLWIFPMVLLDWTFRRDERLIFQIPNVYLRNILYLLIAFAIIMVNKDANTFIYFQF